MKRMRRNGGYERNDGTFGGELCGSEQLPDESVDDFMVGLAIGALGGPVTLHTTHNTTADTYMHTSR